MPEAIHRSCHLCEACCGLEFHVEDDKILSVRPDAGDAFSAGYACPKGIAIAAVHDDPDRENEREQRHHVDRHAEDPHHAQRADERDPDSHGRPEGELDVEEEGQRQEDQREPKERVLP